MGNEVGRRRTEDFCRGRILIEETTLAHHGNPVAQAHSFVNVVRDDYDGLLHSLLEGEELVLQVESGDRVNRAERFVHEQDRRVRCQGARNPDSLTLAPGKLMRIAITELGSGQPDEFQHLVNTVIGCGFVPLQESTDRRNVLSNRQMRKQSDLLDDVSNPEAQFPKWHCHDVATIDADCAGRWFLEAVDHAHSRGLAAARRAHEDADFTGADLQIEWVHSNGAVRIRLGRAVEGDHRLNVFATVHFVPFHGAFALAATTDIEPVPNPWFSWEYVVTHQEQLITAGYEHLLLTLTSVALAMGIAIPLALLVRRFPKYEGPVLGLGGVLYTIPSLALISVLWPVFGLSPWTVVVALALYALLVVLRNTVVGLKGVPVDAVDAARGMGFSKSRILLRVEFPLALPTILAGVRIATVSTVGLVTIGALVGYGGYGSMIYTGFLQNFWHAQIMTATIACVLLAMVLELILQIVERMTTPWARSVRSR